MLDEIYWLGINPQIPSLDSPLVMAIAILQEVDFIELLSI